MTSAAAVAAPTRPRATTVLAFTLVAIDMVGAVLVVLLVAPQDAPLATYRSPQILYAALSFVVGGILAWKRPRVPIGWLLLATGVLYALQGPAVAIGLATQHTHPGIAAWASEFGPESDWTWVPFNFVPLTLVILRFPDGRLPSPRWRWFWWACIGLMVVAAVLSDVTEESVEFGVTSPTYLAWTATGTVNAVFGVIVDIAVLTLVIGPFVSLLVRYRRAGVVERAQLRWVFWALAVIVGTLLVGFVYTAVVGSSDSPGWAGIGARALEFTGDLVESLLPVAILVAVLRSGLYAIDRIISRTAAYAVVTLGIVAVYASVIVLGSLLVPGLPAVGTATATLAAAAIFLPLLRVMRRVVDRRFDRSQYDAQAVVDAFGERVRTGADPHTADDDLLAAVRTALHPSAIGIWRREAS